MNETEIEPYKLSEIFSIIPEFDGEQIFLHTFLSACDCANSMATGNQKMLLSIHIKNKLRAKAAQIINSRNPNSYQEIKSLLNTHFGDTRDMSSLIQDLQRMRQLPNETALIFLNRLETLDAKLHSVIHRSKEAQVQLIDSMVLNTLLTGLEPKLAHIIRASNPSDLFQAKKRIRRELQLSYFENQKFNTSKQNTFRSNQNQEMRKPNLQTSKCINCGRLGHFANNCPLKINQYSNQSSSSPNFQRTASNYPNRPQFQSTQRPPFQPTQRPQFQPRGNTQSNSQQRPSVIQRNPNFNENPNTRAHLINQDISHASYDYEEPLDYDQQPEYYQDEGYSANFQDYQQNESYSTNFPNYQQNEDYSANLQNEYYNEKTNAQNFRITTDQNHPPIESLIDQTSIEQIRTLNPVQTQSILNLPNFNLIDQNFI